jgi:putative photosynthetic complex assembly protein 2
MITGLMIALYVIAAWWCSTGLILYLGRLPHRTFSSSLGVASALLVPTSLMLHWSSQSTSLAGACVAFGAALLIWGWLEISFLLGIITGPRRSACHAGCHGLPHLLHAIEAILYHELATIAAALLVACLTWHAPNLTGLWTFLILWAMRISAKLNLFLGVPNTGEIMLPTHLKYLAAFFRRRRFNALLPVSLTLAALLCVMLVGAACSGPWNFGTYQLSLLATLAGLALVEHCMLMLPVRADAPWRMARSAATLRADSGPAL